jgi:hypothetical protein
MDARETIMGIDRNGHDEDDGDKIRSAAQLQIQRAIHRAWCGGQAVQQ